MEIKNLTDDELESLESSESESEWDRACDGVKRARGGVYPPDWYARVVLSGVVSAARLSWTLNAPLRERVHGGGLALMTTSDTQVAQATETRTGLNLDALSEDALRAEIERLEKDRNYWRDLAATLQKKLNAVREERDELADALEAIRARKLRPYRVAEGWPVMSASTFRAIGWWAVGMTVGLLLPDQAVPSWAPWVIAILGGLLVLGSLSDGRKGAL